MTALAAPPPVVDPLLAGDVLAHLATQVASAARLLQAVLAQGTAIRDRDVDGVVRQVAAFQAELERRQRLEEDRARLLVRAAAALGVQPAEVTLGRLTTLMSAADAELAHARSAELRGMLEEATREHQLNQALMRQELAFLDHLLRLIEPQTTNGYEASGTVARTTVPTASAHRALDLQA